ncbi:beta-microseminoprotein-like isoform X2 [Indicator indicator]|uniref:beta-microseminoprotein-like isoform X2 n=1 Tax=Indicator indicator TaxID=1002788 RepID=UPI0023DFD78A|nr:beta-microseminoprotein-like isoform X2 [Indicator indicator]
MKGFLAFLVVMGIVVTLGDAYCFSEAYKPGQATKGCFIDGKLYPFGEIERTENCHRCSCSQTRLSCCTLFHTPIGYDKENCDAVFNKETCDYDVVQKNDPSKECSVYSRVG